MILLFLIVLLMSLGCFAGATMCIAWLFQLSGKTKERKRMEEVYYQNKKEIAKIQKKGISKEEQALLDHYQGKIALPPMKTPDRFEIMGENTLEFYKINGREIIRAIDSQGKDLGMEFNSITGAVLALEKNKLLDYRK